MMDTSFWTQCNPNISIEHTVKKFYGKYLYKLVLYAPAGRLIFSSGDITDGLEYRKTFSYNQGGSWWVRKSNSTLQDTSVSLLENIRQLKIDHLPDIKIRVEEPRIQIYSQYDQQLKDIVSKYLSVVPASYIETVSGPADIESEDILNTGAIIRKNDIGYQYKITLRDGTYSAETRKSILNYLQNLDVEQVRVPNGTFDMLARPSPYLWGCYIYTNDLSTLTFLQLIAPGIVGNYHELIVVPHK